jgi:hypothetical protein
MKLIRVNRGSEAYEVSIHPDARLAMLINPREMKDNENNVIKKAEFFTIQRDEDTDRVVKALATQNPGSNVEVYDLKSVSFCPAAEMITKEVTKDGVLPYLE